MKNNHNFYVIRIIRKMKLKEDKKLVKIGVIDAKGNNYTYKGYVQRLKKNLMILNTEETDVFIQISNIWKIEIV